MTSPHIVTIARSAGGFGFTPFKVSLEDTKRTGIRVSVDYSELRKACEFALSEGGLPVQAVAAQGPADVAVRMSFAWSALWKPSSDVVRSFTGSTALGCDSRNQ